MNSFLHDFLVASEKNWKEVDLLIAKAKEAGSEDIELHNALCRSIIILMVSHLEGYLKGLVKSVVDDFNLSCSFDEFPRKMQATYCVKYLDLPAKKSDKSYNEKLENLISKFEDAGCKVEVEPFLFRKNNPGNDGGNGNPKEGVVKRLLQNFGVKDVFSLLHESSFDDVFSMTHGEVKDFIHSTKMDVMGGGNGFPYTFEGEKYKLAYTAKINQKPLWVEFLEETNRKRHTIVHGNDFYNEDDISRVDETWSKVMLFQYALAAVLMSEVTPKQNSN